MAAGFPAGQTPLKQRLEEIEEAVKYGANEIDIGNALINSLFES